MSTNKRIRGRQLQAIRAAHFAKHPLCVTCKAAARIAEATQLDHIVPLFKGGRDVESNRQGLCALCHDLKTQIDLGHARREAIEIDGWPLGTGGASLNGEPKPRKPSP